MVYQKIDDALMYCANKAVKAYHWTTGRTKADLANKLLTIAPIAESSGMMFGSWSELSILFTPLALFLSHIHQKRNSEWEESELKYLESQAKDLKAEKYEKDAKLDGLINFAVAGIDITLTPLTTNDFQYVFGAGFAVRGFSHYVMRADPVSPQKNVLRRAADKLEDMVKKYKTPPVPISA